MRRCNTETRLLGQRLGKNLLQMFVAIPIFCSFRFELLSITSNQAVLVSKVWKLKCSSKETIQVLARIAAMRSLVHNCSTRQFWSMPIQPRSFEFHRFSFVKFDATTFRRQNTDGVTKFLRLANNVFHRRKLG
jgi:hypothetical protein